MKVCELEGVKLDYWVAKATGREMAMRSTGLVVRFLEGGNTDWRPFHPSTDWAQGGPIIEREGISLLQIGQGDSGVKWSANFETWYEDRDDPWTGPTPLIAAMRAFVASKYGEEVPDEG